MLSLAARRRWRWSITPIRRSCRSRSLQIRRGQRYGWAGILVLVLKPGQRSHRSANNLLVLLLRVVFLVLPLGVAQGRMLALFTGKLVIRLGPGSRFGVSGLGLGVRLGQTIGRRQRWYRRSRILWGCFRLLLGQSVDRGRRLGGLILHRSCRCGARLGWRRGHRRYQRTEIVSRCRAWRRGRRGGRCFGDRQGCRRGVRILARSRLRTGGSLGAHHIGIKGRCRQRHDWRRRSVFSGTAPWRRGGGRRLRSGRGGCHGHLNRHRLLG
jgi:hypothetical protein